MKIVINIPDEKAERFLAQMRLDRNFRECEVTPLPKGHGDLKDVHDIINKINLNYNNHQSIDAYSLKDMIATVPTIIKADTESEG